MSKLLLYIISVLFGFTLTSCGTTPYFYCYVDAIGQIPVNKKYFVENYFPSDLNPLVAAEYNTQLEKVMAHKGYVRTDSTNADLKVVFGYSLGNVVERAYNYSTPIYQYNPGISTTTTNTTLKNSYGQTIANAKTTTTQKSNPSIDIVGTSVGTSYSTLQDVSIILDAYNTITREPVWSVTITDNAQIELTSNLRKWIACYLLSAEPYIGGNTNGKQFTKIYYTKDERLREFQFNP